MFIHFRKTFSHDFDFQFEMFVNGLYAATVWLIEAYHEAQNSKDYGVLFDKNLWDEDVPETLEHGETGVTAHRQ